MSGLRIVKNEPRIIYRTRSELTKALLRIDGKPINLDDYPMFTAIYDGGHKKTNLITCRQVGKSTTLSNFSISESIAIDFFKTFFIAPTQEQTHKFSTGRVGKTIEYSPLIKKAFTNEKTSNRVLARVFTNGSEILFSYASDDADRCRGPSADRLCLDEVQDMLLDAVLPVVKESLSNSDYQYEMYCGTPKTFENGIQHIWETSSMTEWAIPCEGCGKYSVIRSEKQLGKWGPICTKCKTYLNPRNGFWVDTQSKNIEWEVKGFHISRPMMPRSVPVCWNDQGRIERAKEQWKEVLLKLEGPNPYPLSMFRNEVLGVSDSQGRRIVTIERLRELCDGPPISMKPGPVQLHHVDKICAGIDWSGGGTQIKSRTVLWILGKIVKQERYRTMFFKIFPGANPVDEVNEIAAIISNFSNVSVIACDAGEGNANTDMLRKRLSNFNPQQIVKIRYVSSKFYARWDREGNFYAVNRTNAMDSTMSAINRGEFQFPKDPDHSIMGVAFTDILNEYEEVSELGNRTWKHAPTSPDDCLHALNFNRIAMQIARGEIDLSS